VFEKPGITIARSVVDKYASEGTLRVVIDNKGEERRGVYSELWPWWVTGWMHEISTSIIGEDRREFSKTSLQQS